MTWSDKDLYEYRPDDYDDDLDEDDDEFYDCGMTPDGQCMKAGSEECDWECPIMADILHAEMRAKAKKESARAVAPKKAK